jgi:serine protease
MSTGSRAQNTTTTGSSDVLPPGYDSNRFILTYKTKVGKAAIVNAASKVHYDFGRIQAIAATVPVDCIAALQENPLISVESDPPRFSVGSMHPSSFLRGAQGGSDSSDRHLQSQQTTPYGITMVQADQISSAFANSKTVCIMDSGYALGHPDLPSTGVRGYSDNWSQDGCSHGTQ